MATMTAIVTRTVVIFSHDADGTFSRMIRLSRKGLKDAQVVESTARQGQQVVVVRVKVGSEAEKEARRLQQRGEILTRVGEAIREGRAYLDTAWGKRKVIGYNDRMGEALTRNDGEGWLNERRFVVCVDQIRIEEAAQVMW